MKEFVYHACCEEDARRALKLCFEDIQFKSSEWVKVHEHIGDRVIILESLYGMVLIISACYIFTWGEMFFLVRNRPRFTETEAGRSLLPSVPCAQCNKIDV